ncbi:MAG: DUF3090 domain-containing protein [Microthrixaceae bacterium]|nr:DUF3090 family protein [Microthrixaceae bacterium]MCO5317578.1 DUF3090 domain-containing protein [Microthrixaceae bacterium]
MSTGESFEFEGVDAFVPGALGEPGNRTFYLQARAGERIVTLRCEKQQVGMLGRYLTQLAEAIGPVEPDRDIVGLVEPVEEQWTVGQLSVGVDEDNGLILVTAEELVVDSVDPDPDVELDDDLLAQLIEATESLGEDAAEARFVLSAAQALAFGETAEELIAAGRPPCRLCGAPMDPEGHACPRWN